MTLITRRGLVGGGAIGAGLLLSGCDRLAEQPAFPQNPVLRATRSTTGCSAR